MRYLLGKISIYACAALQVTEGCLGILKERNYGVATIIDEVSIEKFKEMLVSSAK